MECRFTALDEIRLGGGRKERRKGGNSRLLKFK